MNLLTSGSVISLIELYLFDWLVKSTRTSRRTSHIKYMAKLYGKIQ